jgi:hypothetical protein
VCQKSKKKIFRKMLDGGFVVEEEEEVVEVVMEEGRGRGDVSFMVLLDTSSLLLFSHPQLAMELTVFFLIFRN